MKNLTEGKPIKVILIFAFPLFIGQMFQLFYSLVDTRIVGEILGESALAAVGATSTLSDLFLSILIGSINGFGIIIATFFGAKNEEKMKKAMAGTILLGVSIALVLSICSLLFLSPILQFLNISKSLLPMATSYITILLAGLLITTLYNILATILRAMGDSLTPLIFLIVAAILNIFLDYAFILYLHTGVSGAALATILSQAFSALLCFIYMRRKYPQLTLTKEDFKIDTVIFSRLFATGSSMAFMSAFVQFGTFALQTSINTFGTNTIVAHTAARKATSLFMMPWNALGTTLATYCGQNLGAGKYYRIKKGLLSTVLLTWICSIIAILITYTLSPQMISAITASEEADILQTATLYLKVNTVFYFIPSVICLFRNAMQGFGDSKTPVFSSALELLTKIAIAFLFAPTVGYWAIVISEPIAWSIMVIPLVVNTFRNPIWKKSTASA